MRRIVAAAMAAGLAAVALLVGFAPAALAHDRLKGTEPAQGAALTSAPTFVKLTFTEPVLTGSAQIRVTGPSGVVSVGAVSTLGDTVAIPLAPTLPNGSFTVDWRVTSSDGHPVSGTWTFTLQAAAPSPSPSAAASSSAPSPSTVGSPSAAASPSPSVDLSPVKTAAPEQPSALPVVLALVATLAVAAGAWFALVRRRR